MNASKVFESGARTVKWLATQVFVSGADDCRENYGHARFKRQSGSGSPGPNPGFVGIFERSNAMGSRICVIARHRRTHPLWGALSLGLIIALIVTGGARAQETAESPLAVETEQGVPAKPLTSTGKTRLKLDSIILPKLDFRDATISEALDFLTRTSREADPEKIGVKIFLNLDSGLEGVRPVPGLNPVPVELSDRCITFSLLNIPLKLALNYVTQLSETRFRIEDRGVVVVSSNSPDVLLTNEWVLDPADHPGFFRKNSAGLKAFLESSGLRFPEGTFVQSSGDGRHLLVKNHARALEQIDWMLAAEREDKARKEGARKLLEKLDRIIVPQVTFRDATLREAIEFMRRKISDLDTEEPDRAKRGISVVIRMEAEEIAGRRITMSLSNVSLGEVLRAICRNAQCDLHLLNGKVEIAAINAPPPASKPSPERLHRDLSADVTD